MAKVICKYSLDNESIYVPDNSQVLCVKLQEDVPYVWILEDICDEVNLLQFEIVGTEEEFDDKNKEYVGTYMDGSFVWHVFKVIK